jgi:sterol desaturase/sphingolipid hydroxylase (fatty acid hydroxylase superfamily)
MTELDVLGTSRNTLWTSFLIVYLWIHALIIYLLHDPSWYILGVSLTSALDLWRHSQFGLASGSRLYNWLNPWLNLPQDHAWHHAEIAGYNFGANFKLWDKMHGTYYSSDSLPNRLGIKTDFNLIQKLIWPYRFIK